MTCQHCGGPLATADRTAQVDDTGTRLDRSTWLAHLEADPFCSAACCRAAHSLPEAGLEAPTQACSDCGKELSAGRNANAGPRCQDCAEKDRKRRRYNTPGLCAGCGCPLDERSSGCTHCWGRFRKRERRLNDPVFRDRVNEQSRAAKARARASKSAACSPVSQASTRAERSVPGGGDLSTREQEAA